MRIKFNNFNDFKNYVNNAPQKAKQLVLKAFPNYANQLTQEYKSTIQNIGKNIKPIAKNTLKYGGKALGKIVPAAAAVAETPQLFNSNNSLKSKILSGAGIATSFFNPVAGAALLGGAAIERGYGQKLGDNNYKQYEQQYGTPTFPNVTNLAPNLKPLTDEEQSKVLRYLGNKEMEDSDRLIEIGAQQMLENQALIDQYDKSLNNLSAIQNALFNNVIPDNRYIPQQNNQTFNERAIASSNTPSVPQGNMNYPIQNQQVNMRQGMDSNQYRQGAVGNFANLQNMVNNNITNQQRQVNSDAINYYARLAGEQAAINDINREKINQEYINLLNDYRKAANLDMIQNTANNIANTMTQLTYDNPVYYVSYENGLQRIGGDKKPYQPLPTNMSSNVDDFTNTLALKSQQLKDTKPDTSMLDVQRELMSAQALGNYYGVDPMLFLSNQAKEVATGGNTLMNTREGAYQDRQNIIPNTLADIIKQQNKIAGDIDVEQIKQNYMNNRAYADILAAADRQEKQINGQLAVARQYGANARELAELKNRLIQNNPELMAIKYVQATGNYINPEDALQQYQLGLSLFGGTQPQQDMSGAPVQNGNITPAGYQRMLRYRNEE